MTTTQKIPFDSITADAYTDAEAWIEEQRDEPIIERDGTLVEHNRWAQVTVRLMSPEGSPIAFAVLYAGEKHSYEASFDFTESFGEGWEPLFNEGQACEVRDEDDDIVTDSELNRRLWDIIETRRDLWEDKTRALLPKPEIEDMDMTDDTDMQTITVKRDDAPSLRFSGELLAEVSSSPNNA